MALHYINPRDFHRWKRNLRRFKGIVEQRSIIAAFSSSAAIFLVT